MQSWRMCAWVGGIALLRAWLPCAGLAAYEPQFVRGEVNDDGEVNIADAVTIFSALFLGKSVGCRTAMDVNDDDNVDLSDGSYLLNFQFLGGPVIPPPHRECGVDPTPGRLSCEHVSRCAAVPSYEPVFVVPPLTATHDRDYGREIDLKIAELIAQAAPRSKVRIAMYKWEEWCPDSPCDPILEAIKEALNNDVDVRLVIEYDIPATAKFVDNVVAPILGRSAVHRCTEGCLGRESHQHNKFVLLSAIHDDDGRESPFVVVQSSANFHRTGSTKHNNALVVKGDRALYEAYDDYWNRLSQDGKNGVQQRHVVGDCGAEAYFLPQPGNVIDELLDTLSNPAGLSVRVVMAQWDDKAIWRKLVEFSRGGADVQVVLREANPADDENEALYELQAGGVEVMAYPPGGRAARESDYEGRDKDGDVHSKYMLIEETLPDGEARRRVITGSPNYTDTGLMRNDEAVLVVEDPLVWGAYDRNFRFIRDLAQTDAPTHLAWAGYFCASMDTAMPSPGGATRPDIAAVAGAGHVVAWFSDGNICLRTIDAAGVSSPVARHAASTQTGHATDIAIATNSAGEFVVVWEQTSGIGIRHGHTSDITVLTDPRQSVAKAETSKPDVALNGDGIAVVAWHDSEGSVTVRFDVRRNSMEVLSRVEDARDPGVAIDGDRCLIVWELEVGSDVELLAQEYDLGSLTPVGAELEIDGDGQNADPAIAAAAEREYVVTWHDGEGVKLRLVRDGRVVGDKIHVHCRSGPPECTLDRNYPVDNPTLSIDREGRILVVWQDAFTLSGGGGKQNCSDGINPESSRDGCWNVWYRGFEIENDGFQSLGDPRRVNPEIGGHQTRPSIAVNDAGTVCFVWQDEKDPDSGANLVEVWARSFVPLESRALAPPPPPED